MKTKLTLFLLLLSFSLVAQDKYPTKLSLETLAGRRSALDVSASKQFATHWRYRALVSFISCWDIKDGKVESLINNHVDYMFNKNIALSAGLQYHFLKGLVPNVSVLATHATPTWLLLVSPSMGFATDQYTGIIANIEYKPLIAENTRLFLNGKAYYNYNITTNAHDKSFYYARVGVTFKKVTVGAGAHFDFYGADVNEKDNFGGFLRVNF